MFGKKEPGEGVVSFTRHFSFERVSFSSLLLFVFCDVHGVGRKPEPETKMNTTSSNNTSSVSSFYAAKFAAGFRFIATKNGSKNPEQKFFRTDDELIEFTMTNAVGYLGSFDASGKLSRVTF